MTPGQKICQSGPMSAMLVVWHKKKIANTIDVGTGHMEHSLVCLKKLSES